MAPCLVEPSAIVAPLVRKPSQIALIPFTIAAPEQIRQVLQYHAEGSSLRGIARTTGLAYNPVVSLVRAASHKAQQVHNAGVSDVKINEGSADDLWSFVKKSKNTASQRG